ncbi:Rho1 guanine nucleotide exchange factor 1 [Sparassis crispa]|uniref:Rho1 guanine nucleotide exchange factor 1 n=1 Tax=Sparassis crispa TaxID=139825 RepID=A0A401GRW8_9APHY|nr:Rho1 guanine nucleotide exchange factor 1 [Sparassis crispa]GBE84474.1 Rho1 guanine nucleotide exchange factor 1 [Sparassis crispa]
MSQENDISFWRTNTSLTFRMGEGLDLDLLNEDRSVIHTGRLLERSDAGLGSGLWTEVFVLVLDNYLIVAQREENNGVGRYRVLRQPIALELVSVMGSADSPVQRRNSVFRRASAQRGNRTFTLRAGFPIMSTSTEPSPVYAFTIRHSGKHGGFVTLCAETPHIRNEWRLKLEEASRSRKSAQVLRKILDVSVFAIDVSHLSSISAPAHSERNTTFNARMTCSIPFTTADGRDLVAIGCEAGVWFGLRHDPQPFHRMLNLKMVSQCAILEEYGIFLVLADKSLYAYDLEALVPSSRRSAPAARKTPQRLSGKGDVAFFRVGNVNGTTLVIYAKWKRNETTFRALEPDISKRTEKTPTLAELGLKEWFKIHTNFYIPCECFDVIFLRRKIAIPCVEGFVIMMISDPYSVMLPHSDDRTYKPLLERCRSSRPRGMFRVSSEEFLLCYDNFGLYVDEHGDPSRPSIMIEWEGTAECAAHLPPYILLFNTNFIEVRHLQTGCLAQILPGDGLRCLCDGRDRIASYRGGMPPPPCVHGVMNSEPDIIVRSGVEERPTALRVFDLIPIVSV